MPPPRSATPPRIRGFAFALALPTLLALLGAPFSFPFPLMAENSPPSAHPLPPLPADPRVRALIDTYHLEYLPGESGYFGQLNVSALDVTSGSANLKAHSSIYYLLTREAPINYLHRLESDDVHMLLEGGPVEYLIFHPDGRADRRVLGRDQAHGETLMISVPGGCWKALRLLPGAPFALMANVLTPQWTPDRVHIGAGPAFIAQFSHAAPWATPALLRELIGPNWKEH